MLPPERNFVRSGGFRSSLRQMLRHLRDPQLVATYAIGFGVLFNFIATFTYVSFHLAAPPYLFSPTLLGALFFTYLVEPDRAVGRAGRSRCSAAGRSCSASSRYGSSARCCCWRRRSSVIMTGLTLCAVCGMVCQAISTGYVAMTAKEGRSSAVGLYGTAYSMWAAAPARFSAALPGLSPAGAAASQ